MKWKSEVFAKFSKLFGKLFWRIMLNQSFLSITRNPSFIFTIRKDFDRVSSRIFDFHWPSTNRLLFLFSEYLKRSQEQGFKKSSGESSCKTLTQNLFLMIMTHEIWISACQKLWSFLSLIKSQFPGYSGLISRQPFKSWSISDRVKILELLLEVERNWWETGQIWNVPGKTPLHFSINLFSQKSFVLF